MAIMFLFTIPRRRASSTHERRTSLMKASLFLFWIVLTSLIKRARRPRVLFKRTAAIFMAICVKIRGEGSGMKDNHDDNVSRKYTSPLGVMFLLWLYES